MYKLLILVYISYAAAAVFESRIVNGRDALPGEFGYIVSLQKHHYHLCGGSIIDEDNVITAAHCLEGNMINYRIQYGVIDIVPNNVNIIQVRKAFIHESFNPRITMHDIAILRLSSPFPLDFITLVPIPLPIHEEEYPAHSLALTAGWGSVDMIQGDASERLQVKVIQILHPEECTRAYRWLFGDDQLCLGNTHDVRGGPCNGDSGSPLIINEKLAGISSWSLKRNGICAVREFPAVFTKASYYVIWILEQLSKI